MRREIRLSPGLAVSRSALDAALARAAVEAGATFFDGASARLEQLGARQRITLTRGGESWELTAGVVIAADGVAGSFLKGHTPMEARVRSGGRIGVATRLARAPELSPGAIVMVSARHAYVGVVRAERGAAQLAASVDPSALREAGGPAALLGPMLSAVDLDADLDNLQWHGTPPLARRRPDPAHPGVFLVGDAAGYEAPFTGEGMAWAVASALASRPFVLEALRGRGDPAAWARCRSRLLSGRMLRCRAISAIVHRPRVLGAILRIGGAIPGMLDTIAAFPSRPLAVPGAAR